MSASGVDRIELQKHAVDRYRKAGLSVLPLVYRGRWVDAQALRATGDLGLRGAPTWRRYQNKPAGDREIDIWFGSQPRNVAILGTRSVVIFDFDLEGAFDAWAESCPEAARNTAIQKTSRGFHVLFKTRKGPSTVLRTEFSLLKDGMNHVGEVLGRGRYCIAWPSTSPEGHEYRWLPGQAPWESGIMEIDRSEDVGLKIVRDWLRYFRFLYLLLTDPLNSGDMIQRKIASYFGQRTNEVSHLFKK